MAVSKNHIGFGTVAVTEWIHTCRTLFLLNTICEAVGKNKSIRRRLEELGVIDGTKIQCLFKSPLGDPSAYLFRGAVIALRREDADAVLIERKEGNV